MRELPEVVVAVTAALIAGCGGSGSGPADAASTADARCDACADAGAGDADACKADADVRDVGDAEFPPEQDLLGLVDPMIGTKGGGNTIPGPQLPHGMVKLSPDTEVEAGAIEGYEYGDSHIQGFSHTHLEGPGGSGYGYSQVLLMPFLRIPQVDEEGYARPFDHDGEVAEPGYYRVVLQNPEIVAELTATHRAGVHRYTLPGKEQGGVLIDVSHSRGVAEDGSVTVVPPDVVEGVGVYDVWPAINMLTEGEEGMGKTGMRTLFFHVRFDRPFVGFGTWSGKEKAPDEVTASGDDIGAYVTFEPADPNVVHAVVGISFIDLEQAEANAGEVAGFDFDGVRAAARGAWNSRLNRILVEGGTPAQRTQFYTALYQTMMQPVDYGEGARFWVGFDGVGRVMDSQGHAFYNDDWCIWDTFRTTHPLQSLTEPEQMSDLVRSYLVDYEVGGWLPKCPWQVSGYSRAMIGYHAASVIADLYLKGFDGFDVEEAWTAVVKSATKNNPNVGEEMGCGYLALGTVPDYLQRGYVPVECDQIQSVSMTLEYAYDDWCVSRLADALGKSAAAQEFGERAGSYQNHFNPEVGFMQARWRNGDWVEPFDPAAADHFCEADSWKYTWSVPHDVEGLIKLMGGPDAFAAKLDEFFDGGHFAADNEPDFHVPWLYNYAGRPWQTQERVRAILGTAFSPTPGGLPGNDDAGATAAWYVLAAVGLYPVAPGDLRYQLSSPLFDRITLRLDPPARKPVLFVIETHGNSEKALYIQSATLNGQPFARPWLTWEEIVSGGTLVLEMGETPSEWGVGL